MHEVLYNAVLPLTHVSTVAEPGMGTSVDHRPFDVVHMPHVFDGHRDCGWYVFHATCPTCGDDVHVKAKVRRAFILDPKCLTDGDPRFRAIVLKWLRLCPNATWLWALLAASLLCIFPMILMFAPNPPSGEPVISLGISDLWLRWTVFVVGVLTIAGGGTWLISWRKIKGWIKDGRPLLVFARVFDGHSDLLPSQPVYYLERVIVTSKRRFSAGDHCIVGLASGQLNNPLSPGKITYPGGRWFYADAGYATLNEAWAKQYQSMYTWTSSTGSLRAP